MQTPSYLANFDSGATMVRTLVHILWEKDFPAVGTFPYWCLPALRLAGGVINCLP